MTQQSLLRLIKRWRRYEAKKNWEELPKGLRGLYVLYRHDPATHRDHEVVYIGVAGLGEKLGGGIRSRLRSHSSNKDGWTHFSLFEVHDNITRAEIRELEAMLLEIFRDDPRIGLSNKQKGSRPLKKLRQWRLWKEVGVRPVSTAALLKQLRARRPRRR